MDSGVILRMLTTTDYIIITVDGIEIKVRKRETRQKEQKQGVPTTVVADNTSHSDNSGMEWFYPKPQLVTAKSTFNGYMIN